MADKKGHCFHEYQAKHWVCESEAYRSRARASHANATCQGIICLPLLCRINIYFRGMRI